jgi:8-oxo-dGTP pyrophosphatase MutT (NUDIX family)
MAEQDLVPTWTVYGERTLHADPWMRLVQLDAEPPAGERRWYNVVRLHRIAIAAIIDPDRGCILMLRRHRVAIDQVGWELPGGIVDPTESPEEAAVRETEEETGWRPLGEPRLIAQFQPIPGAADNPHFVYLVTGAKHIAEPTDPDESGRVEWVPIESIPGLISSGSVLGCGSVVGLLEVQRLQQVPGGLDHRPSPAPLQPHRAGRAGPVMGSAPGGPRR